jgi:hypothetical protein
MADVDAILRFLGGVLSFALVGYLLLLAPRDGSARWYRRPTPVTVRGLFVAFVVLLLAFVLMALLR